MKIAITSESTIDLNANLLQAYDIKVIPFEIVLGNKTIKDGDRTNAEIFEFVDKNNILPKTNALNDFEYGEFFESVLKNYDCVIHIAMSSGLTSSCGNAIRVAKEMQNVYVIDSESLTSGMALLAMYARELANKGLTPEEIVSKVEERKTKIQVSFVVERLDYLHKGGRCSSLAMFGANLLKLRPRIVMSEGRLTSDKKYRGLMSSVVSKYSQDVLQDFNTPDLNKVFITFSSATPEMIEAAREVCEGAGFKNIYEATAGCTVASHCGANTMGIIYFNDGGEE